jgi:hypothetical protein
VVSTQSTTRYRKGFFFFFFFLGINDIILFPVHKNEIQIPKLTPCNYLIKANKGKQQE